MRTAVSEADLKDSIHEFEEAMVTDCMAIPLYAPRFFYAWNDQVVQNVVAYPSMVYGVASVQDVLRLSPAN
jgi:hypothetical protein